MKVYKYPGCFLVLQMPVVTHRETVYNVQNIAKLSLLNTAVYLT